MRELEREKKVSRGEEAGGEKKKLVGVVVPTYNEIANIQAFLEALLKHLPEAIILVVDDSSPDRTWEVVEQYAKRYAQVHLLKRPHKTGLGNAYKEGFQELLKYPVDVIFQVDADFSHPIESMMEMVKLTEQWDVVVGSRYLKGVSVVNWSLSRILLSYTANSVTRLVTRMPIYDMTSGFKCYRREVFDNFKLAALESSGFFFQVEINFVLYKMGFRFYEHPIIFKNRQEGFSKIDTKVVAEGVWYLMRQPFNSVKKYRR